MSNCSEEMLLSEIDPDILTQAKAEVLKDIQKIFSQLEDDSDDVDDGNQLCRSTPVNETEDRLTLGKLLNILNAAVVYGASLNTPVFVSRASEERLAREGEVNFRADSELITDENVDYVGPGIFISSVG